MSVGPVWVADFGSAPAITATMLESADIPGGTKRLLLKTANSKCWQEEGRCDFIEDYIALSVGGADWVRDKGVEVVGIDYLSIELYGEPENKTHHILLGNDIVVIEGLNLTGVESGAYELMCLPLKLKGIEGAPARVFLRQGEGK